MFNTTSQKTTINNPATGIIQRSNEKSFNLILHYNSSLASKLFEDDAKYNGKNISILQTLLIHNERLIVEIVYTDDL